MAKSSRDIKRQLEQAGWRQVRQAGSHIQFRQPAARHSAAPEEGPVARRDTRHREEDRPQVL